MNLNWNQVNAIGRHAASYAAGGITGAVAVGLLSSSQGTGLGDGVQHITNGLEEIAKGVALIAGIVTPIYTAWRAGRSASPSEQVKSVVTQLSAPKGTQAANALADPDSRTKLIEAVAEMPEVKKIIPTDPALAATTASPKVAV